MLSWLARLARPLMGSCLVIALILAGAPAASAQSTMDPAIDSDGDGTMNNMDFDDDNDGFADDIDCAPFDNLRWSNCNTNPPPGTGGEPDSDGDGIADRADPDDDNDGVVDQEDSNPLDPNVGTAPGPPAGEQDSDGDGIADGVDPDDDNDGATDEVDCAPFDASVSACPTPTPVASGGGSDGSSGGVSGGSGGIVVTSSGGSSVGSARAPIVTSLPSTGTGGPSPLASMAVVAGIAAMLLALAGLRGWLHPARPDR